jgi:hypothetical protein
LLHISFDAYSFRIGKFDGIVNVWKAIYESPVQTVDLLIHSFSDLPPELYYFVDKVGQQRVVNLNLLVHSNNDILSLKLINSWRRLAKVSLLRPPPQSRLSDFLNKSIDWAQLIQNPSLEVLSLKFLHLRSLPAQLRGLELDYPGPLPLTTWKVICALVSLTSLSLKFDMKQSQDEWHCPHEFKSKTLSNLYFRTGDGDDLVTLLKPILFVCKSLTSLSIRLDGRVGENLINSIFTSKQLLNIQIKGVPAAYNFQDLLDATRNCGPVESLCIPFPGKPFKREKVTLDHAKLLSSCFPVLRELRFYTPRHGIHPGWYKNTLIDSSSIFLERCTSYDETDQTLIIYLNRLRQYL